MPRQIDISLSLFGGYWQQVCGFPWRLRDVVYEVLVQVQQVTEPPNRIERDRLDRSFKDRPGLLAYGDVIWEM